MFRGNFSPNDLILVFEGRKFLWRRKYRCSSSFSSGLPPIIPCQKSGVDQWGRRLRTTAALGGAGPTLIILSFECQTSLDNDDDDDWDSPCANLSGSVVVGQLLVAIGIQFSITFLSCSFWNILVNSENPKTWKRRSTKMNEALTFRPVSFFADRRHGGQ